MMGESCENVRCDSLSLIYCATTTALDCEAGKACHINGMTLIRGFRGRRGGGGGGS